MFPGWGSDVVGRLVLGLDQARGARAGLEIEIRGMGMRGGWEMGREEGSFRGDRG